MNQVEQINLTPNDIKLLYYIVVYIIELIRKYGKKAPKKEEDNIKASLEDLTNLEYFLEMSLKNTVSDLAPIAKTDLTDELEEVYNVLKQNDLLNKVKETIEDWLFKDMTGLFPQDVDTTIRVHTRIQTYKEVLDLIDSLTKESS